MTDKDILITNKEKFSKIRENIKKDGLSNLSIFADFDRTLTYGTVKGKKTPSMIAVLRQDNNYLGEDYSKKAALMAEKYHPIEFDSSIKEEDKRKEMVRWWQEHLSLLIEKKLKKEHLQRIVNERSVSFREDVDGVFNFLRENDVPLVIISASGLGKDPIAMMIEKEIGVFPNVSIISNSFDYDKEGTVIGYSNFIVHTMNKDEVLVKEKSIYEKVKDRKNVILLGDSFDDIKMAENIKYKNLLKICFLNEYTMDKIEDYKKIYDVLVLNDSSMNFVKELLADI